MATLGEQAVGNIVKMNVGGIPYNFIVVHQGLPETGYSSSCKGTWLLMQDLYEKQKYNMLGGGISTKYTTSDLDTYLNDAFLELFDANVVAAIKTALIPCGSGGLLSAKVFLLSYAELRESLPTNAYVEGAQLEYFKNASGSAAYKALLNGVETAWWTRTFDKSKPSQAYYVSSDGSKLSTAFVSTQYGIRPAMIFPSETAVSDDGMVGVESKSITGSVTIGGVQRELTGKGYINIGGVLRDLSDSQVNIGGVLKSTKG